MKDHLGDEVYNEPESEVEEPSLPPEWELAKKAMAVVQADAVTSVNINRNGPHQVIVVKFNPPDEKGMDKYTLVMFDNDSRILGTTNLVKKTKTVSYLEEMR